MNPNLPTQLNENAPLPLPNPLSAVQGFQGWLTSLQKYAQENPGLVAVFGVGLLILASQGMLNPPQQERKGK